MPAMKEATGGGVRLREERKRIGLNQTDFGKRLGVSQGRVSDWETGDSEPSFVQCKRISLAVGRRYETVCGWWEPDERGDELGHVTVTFYEHLPDQALHAA